MAYCYHCFKAGERTDPCPFCGYDPAADAGRFPQALPHGSILAGQYITGRVLGQGGFGITYLALDNNSGERVALKEFLPDTMAGRSNNSLQVTAYDGDRGRQFQYGLDCFMDEAKTLAKFIGNPNIVGVRSYFQENGTAYFAMDYIEGVSFKAYLREQGGYIDWRDALRILTPVMEALKAVHQEGLIHRDVTPDNIYISANGSVKLLDFGAARYSLGDRSRSLDVVLKPGYAPKEQYTRKGKQGPYTDVYSLSACFYAAVTGYLPPESLERAESDDLIPPSERGVQLPSALEQVILYGLAVQPADRYQSMEEFQAAIDKAVSESEAIAPVSLAAENQTPKEPPQKKQNKPLRYMMRAFSAIGITVVLLFAIYTVTYLYRTRTIQVADQRCGVGVYTGSWSDGEPKGTGTMVYDNGDVYTGEWGGYQGRNGSGTMTYANGDYYDGEWEFDRRQGIGTMAYSNGDYYDGEWSYDQKSGAGTMTYVNGDYYDGEWELDYREGAGTMIYANGDVYTGDWVSGDWHGTGSLTCANGDQYEGNWSSGMRCGGTGTMTYENGDRYDGEWDFGVWHGVGTMQYVNGDIYSGGWSWGEKEGSGEMIYADGSRYDGEWELGQRHGNGTYIYADGKTLVCTWSRDNIVADGTGTVTMPNGTVYHIAMVDGKITLQ